MEFLIIFISLIVVYIIGKFIYDTYITDNTERNWEEYEREKKYNETIKQTNHSNDNLKKVNKVKSKNSYNMIDDNEKKELVNSLFIVMDATVLEEISNNPMKGTPLEGAHILNVINELTNSYKEKIREIANNLPVETTDKIVMEASNMVYDKYLE